MPRNRQLYPISAVLLAHQYSELVEKVVKAVTWCDEIVMVLSEPHPELEDLARRVSAKCYFRKFDSYGPQKQFAVSKASHDWILNIDSDEWVSPRLRKAINLLFIRGEPDTFSAFRIRQRFIFLGRPLRFSGTKASPVRLFNRTKGYMTQSSVHEDFVPDGKIGLVKTPLHHTSYSSLDDYLFKFNNYTSLAAEALYEKGKQTNLLLIWGRFPLLFFRRYIFQLGVLDGHNGFLWCWLSAWYSVIKYLKLRELWLKTAKGIPVLMYHAVDPMKQDALTVELSNFEQQLDWLKSEGYESVSVTRFLDFFENRSQTTSFPKKPVLLTFDDGYRHCAEYVLPLLVKKGLTGCLFVNSGYVEEREQKNSDSPYLSVNELKDWSRAGMEIALHSHKHPNYKDLTTETIIADLKKEENCLKNWEIPYLKVLAYPFGARPKNTEALFNALNDLGIRAAFRIGNRLCSWKGIKNRFEIKRIDIQGNDSFPVFCNKVKTGRAHRFKF